MVGLQAGGSGGDAVDAGGGGDDDAGHPGGGGGVHKALGGDDVGVDVLAELGAPGGADAGDAGEVDHGVGIQQQRLDGAGAQVCGDGVVAGAAMEGDHVGAGSGVGVVAVVYGDNGSAGVKQGVDQVRADESGGAGDDNAPQGGGLGPG